MKSAVPNAPADPPPALPEMHTALLGEAEVDALFRDLEACAAIHEINAKTAARGSVPEVGRLTLVEARRLLCERQVRGVQIRYRHEGIEWWDTLMVRPDGWQLVRLRPDCAAPEA